MAIIPEKVSESLKGLKHPKEQLNRALKKAKDTIKDTIAGTGSVKEELTEAKNAAVDVFKETVAIPFKSLNQLVRLHPIDATRELVSGAGSVIGKLVKLATSPARLGVAGMSAGAKAVKAVAKMPAEGVGIVAKSPFYAWNTMARGADKVFGLGRSIWSSVDKRIDKIVRAGKSA